MAETSRLATLRRTAGRSWWRRRRSVVVGTLVMAGLSIYAAGVAVLGYLADRRYWDAVAEADRLDPDWHSRALVANLEPIPEAENSALRVLDVAKDLPASWTRRWYEVIAQE